MSRCTRSWRYGSICWLLWNATTEFMMRRTLPCRGSTMAAMFLSTSGMSSWPALPPKSSTVARPVVRRPRRRPPRAHPRGRAWGPRAFSASRRYAAARRSRSLSKGVGSISSERVVSAVVDEPSHESVEWIEAVVREPRRDLDDLAERHEALHAAGGELVAQVVGACRGVDADGLGGDIDVREARRRASATRTTLTVLPTGWKSTGSSESTTRPEPSSLPNTWYIRLHRPEHVDLGLDVGRQRCSPRQSRPSRRSIAKLAASSSHHCVNSVLLALGVDEPARRADLLVEEAAVSRRGRALTLAIASADASASRPSNETDTLGSKDTRSNPARCTASRSDRGIAAPGDEAVEELGAEERAFDRGVAAPPVDARERLRDRVVRVDLGHRPQDRGAREQVVRRQLQQVHAFRERAAGDGAAGDTGCIAGEHVHEAGRERADPAHATLEVGDLLPAVEHVAARPPGRPGTTAIGVEPVRQRLVRLGEDARTERAARGRSVRACAAGARCRRASTLAHCDEEVDDLGQREVERRSRLGCAATPARRDRAAGSRTLYSVQCRAWVRTRPRTTCGTRHRSSSRLIPSPPSRRRRSCPRR